MSIGQDQPVLVHNKPGAVGRCHGVSGEVVHPLGVLDLYVDNGRCRHLDDIGDEVELCPPPLQDLCRRCMGHGKDI